MHSFQAVKTQDRNLRGRNLWNAGKLKGQAGWLWIHIHMQCVLSSVHFGVSYTKHNIRRSSYRARLPATEIEE